MGCHNNTHTTEKLQYKLFLCPLNIHVLLTVEEYVESQTDVFPNIVWKYSAAVCQAERRCLRTWAAGET